MHTQYTYLSDEELLTVVYHQNTVTDMELELAHRLEALLRTEVITCQPMAPSMVELLAQAHNTTTIRVMEDTSADWPQAMPVPQTPDYDTRPIYTPTEPERDGSFGGGGASGSWSDSSSSYSSSDSSSSSSGGSD